MHILHVSLKAIDWGSFLQPTLFCFKSRNKVREMGEGKTPVAWAATHRVVNAISNLAYGTIVTMATPSLGRVGGVRGLGVCVQNIIAIIIDVIVVRTREFTNTLVK